MLRVGSHRQFKENGGTVSSPSATNDGRSRVRIDGHERSQWFTPSLDDYEGSEAPRSEVLVPCRPLLHGLESVVPNLTSSRLYLPESQDAYGPLHSPVLDLDFAARLLPSSTDGHYHLYLDGLVMPWEKYSDFLHVMAHFGVI